MKNVFGAVTLLILISGCTITGMTGNGLKALSNDFEKITCDTLTRCPEGMDCYKFRDQETPICWAGDPCARCNSGICTIAESYPMQIFCR